jgi:hypothetical protein
LGKFEKWHTAIYFLAKKSVKNIV